MTDVGMIQPEIDEDSRWWWDALERDELRLPHCQTCDRSSFPPMPACPHCGSTELTSIEASGAGTVYSWVVVHHAFDPTFADDTPYTVLAVDVDEGARVLGRLLGSERAVHAGMRVHAEIERVQDTPRLGFHPSAQ